MSEIGAHLGIYGAVDRAVQTDAHARLEVARLLPLYRDPSLHWFDDFEGWLKEERPHAVEHGRPVFPGPKEALEELSEVEPEGRLLPRRLFTIAVAICAFPEMLEPRSELYRPAIGALRPGMLADSDKDAHSLLVLLGAKEDMPNLDGSGKPLSSWWAGVVSAAFGQKLIQSADGMFPRPCSGQLVTVPGDPGQAAALTTEYETEEVEFEAATRFIAPENWKKCMPHFWCDMTAMQPARQGMHRYHEVVSSDCDGPGGGAFRAETELEFNFEFLPEGAKVAEAQAAIANYQLAQGRPAPGDLIVVDEGTLLVARQAPGSKQLLIATTKRIQFNFPFSSQALAIMMCALGYADAAGNLLSCCARNTGKPKAGTKFPAGSPRPSATELRSLRRRRPTARCDTADFGPGQIVQDMAGMWACMLGEWAAAMERGTGGTVTGTRKRNRSED